MPRPTFEFPPRVPGPPSPTLTVVLVSNHMVGGSDDRRHEKRPAMGESWRNQPAVRCVPGANSKAGAGPQCEGAAAAAEGAAAAAEEHTAGVGCMPLHHLPQGTAALPRCLLAGLPCTAHATPPVLCKPPLLCHANTHQHNRPHCRHAAYIYGGQPPVKAAAAPRWAGLHCERAPSCSQGSQCPTRSERGA